MKYSGLCCAPCPVPTVICTHVLHKVHAPQLQRGCDFIVIKNTVIISTVITYINAGQNSAVPFFSNTHIHTVHVLLQELLALLEHIDKDNKGHVSLDEFVQALQSMKHSVPVAASTPPQPIRRRHTDAVSGHLTSRKNTSDSNLSQYKAHRVKSIVYPSGHSKVE